ncbi:MAG: polyisoprenoid-binding protein [Glaciihabitans sp.]|nr:polyisoprenoid-binding protein [Glaciihabitans sp.]
MAGRRRRTIVLWTVGVLVALGAIAYLAGPPLYASYLRSVVAPAPTLEPVPTDPTSANSTPAGPTDGSTGTTSPDELSGSWSVAADSYGGYRVNEVLRGDPVTVTGRTDKIEGTLTVDGFTLTAAELTLDVASIATTEPPRDAYFRDTALEVGKFPTATFVLTGPVTIGAPSVGQPQSLTAPGDLTLHGVTHPVQVQLDAVLTAAGGQVSGSIPITFSDYGVEAPDLGFVAVEDTGSVEFLLNLSKH